MQQIGIIRNIDELGRIVLPKEYRTALNMDAGTPVSMTIEDGAISIRKPEDICQFCGSKEDLIQAGGVRLCRGCAGSIVKLLEVQP